MTVQAVVFQNDYKTYLDKKQISIAITHLNEFNSNIKDLKRSFDGYKIFAM